MEQLHETTDLYMPDAGTVKGPVNCGVCGTEMTVTRDHFGPRGYASALAWHNGNKSVGSAYDSFCCPHREDDWHERVLALRNEKQRTYSKKIQAILEEEAQEILKEWQASC